MKVGVVGVGQVPFRFRDAERNYREMAMEAFLDLLDDTDATREDIDNTVYSIYSEPVMRQQVPDHRIHDYLGLTGTSATRVSAAAASGVHAVREGAIHVESGVSDVTMVLGIQKSSDLIVPETGRRSDAVITGQGITNDLTWEYRVTCMPPNCFSPAYMAHRERWGGPTKEQNARVTVKNYANAKNNPYAVFSKDLTVDDVLSSRLIAEPNHLHDCCLIGDWASCVLLASEERTAELTGDPVWITGAGSSYEKDQAYLEGEKMGRLPAIGQARERAYDMAGIEEPRREIDVVELHDLLSWMEPVTYEELGLCELGEGEQLVEEEATTMDGDVPVNPSGGRVACGHIAGVSGVNNVAEVTRQLRGDAGDRQVEIDAGRGVAQAIGGAGTGISSVVAMERGW